MTKSKFSYPYMAGRGDKKRRAILKQVNSLAWLLDNSIRVPLINYRIGVDAVIGLIPGLGDVVGLLLSSYIVVQAARLGVPRITLLRMVGNIALEASVGIIPIVGDFFDATYKSNARNVQLLNQAVEDAQNGRGLGDLADKGAVAAILSALVGIIGLTTAAGVTVFSWSLTRLRHAIQQSR